jgi:hypothetical protein
MISKQADGAHFEEALRIDPKYKTVQEKLRDVLARKQKAKK